MSEAHVYCQDDHATLWTPLGHSCPVNCATVLEAVKRLKQKEVEIMFSDNREMKGSYDNGTITFLGGAESDDGRDDTNLRRNYVHSGPGVARFNKLDYEHYWQLHKIFNNPKAVKEIQAIFQSMPPSYFKKGCQLFLKYLRSNRFTNVKGVEYLMSKCTRRCDIEKDFIKLFTSTLNKYTTEERYFDEELTQIILQKILGADMELRHGVIEVEKLLNYLQDSISVHSKHTKKRESITLKSRYCINVYMPGCFCVPGFVEHNGQCVKPADCFEDSNLVIEYLARIIIN